MSDSDSQALTAAEHEAVAVAGQLYTHIVTRVLQRGPTFEDDAAELRAAVHVIQRSVLAQAAARAYPGLYRPLGGFIGGDALHDIS